MSSRVLKLVLPMLMAALIVGPLLGGLSYLHAQGVTLILATPKWKILNPLVFGTIYGQYVLDLVYEPLIRYDPVGNLVSALAEKWKIETKGSEKIVTFYLRKGVKWHDGVEVTADDVKYTIDLVLSSPEKYPAVDSIVYKGLKEVKVIDKYTVQFIYDAKEAAADEILLRAFTTMYIVPKHVWEKLSDTTAPLTAEQMIGCGPFKVVEVAEDHVVLVANPDFYRGKPEVDKIVILVVKSRDTFVSMLLNGEVDAGLHFLYGKLLKTTVDQIKAQRLPIQLFSVLSTSNHLLTFNFENPLFKNVKFRKAIAYAINVKYIVSKYYGETAIEGTETFIGPAFGELSLYIPKEELYPYNVSYANKLLDELGYKDTDGDGIRNGPDGKNIVLVLLTRAPGDAFFRDAIGDEIAKMLEKIGIKVEVRKASNYWDLWGQRKFDLAIAGYVPHKPSDLSWWKTGDPGNIPKFSDPNFDKVLDQYLKTGDVKYLYEAQKILAKDLAFISLYHPIKALLFRIDKYKDWVVGPYAYPGGYWSVIGSKVAFNKEGPMMVGGVEEAVKKARKLTMQELAQLNPDLYEILGIPSPTTVVKTATVLRTIVSTIVSGQTIVMTVSITPSPVEKTVTSVVTTTQVVTKPTTTTVVKTEVNWAVTIGLLIIGLIIGFVAGRFVRK